MLKDVPGPELTAGLVMVDVKATGINSAQSLTVVEIYQLKPGLPFVPEIEISDVVPVISGGANSVATARGFSARPRIRRVR